MQVNYGGDLSNFIIVENVRDAKPPSEFGFVQ